MRNYFLFLLFLTTAHSAEKRCSVDMVFQGRVLKVERVKGVARFEETNIGPVERVQLTSVLDDPDQAIFIGIDTRRHHAFFQVGQARHDGRVFGRAKFRKEGLEKANTGTWLVFENLPPATIRKAKKWMQEQEFSGNFAFDCFRSACQTAEKAVGIRPARGYPLDGVKLFRQMLTDGFVDAAGFPVEMKIYQTHAIELEQYYPQLKRYRNAMWVRRPATLAISPVVKLDQILARKLGSKAASRGVLVIGATAATAGVVYLIVRE